MKKPIPLYLNQGVPVSCLEPGSRPGNYVSNSVSKRQRLFWSSFIKSLNDWQQGRYFPNSFIVGFKFLPQDPKIWTRQSFYRLKRDTSDNLNDRRLFIVWKYFVGFLGHVLKLPYRPWFEQTWDLCSICRGGSYLGSCCSRPPVVVQLRETKG